MGYSNTSEVDLIIAQALTSATPQPSTTELVQLVGIGGVQNLRDINRIPDETVQYYITLADSKIDGTLTQQYYTPFNKCANGQWELDEDVNVEVVGGTGTDSAGIPASTTTTSSAARTVIVNDSNNLVPGNEIILHNDLTGTEEILIVDEVVDQYTFTTTADIEGAFAADDGVRVIRIQFPPPLNQISARYAASFIYDKYFAAQATPDVSDYGKEMRSVADGQMNDILNGKIMLKCARRRGDLFGGPYLDSTYGVHKPYGDFDTAGRDMSKP